MSDFFYARKLYALLQSAPQGQAIIAELSQDQTDSPLPCLEPYLPELTAWWESSAHKSCDIAIASDGIELTSRDIQPSDSICHPISGESRQIASTDKALPPWPDFAPGENQQAFWWFWRFYAELRAGDDLIEMLLPANSSLPDCPLHSYQATVSAVVGAMYRETPESAEEKVLKQTRPYLFQFSFSPVQEFIKASRKFLDFWSGSYLLHYLSAKLCWKIANEYGPDSIIVPSLWNQEIIDTLLVQQYPAFEATFRQIEDGKLPAERFNQRDRTQRSSSLNTAGFPNVITVLVPGQEAAEALGRSLEAELTTIWKEIGYKVRDDICQRVSDYCLKVIDPKAREAAQENGETVPNWDALWKEFSEALPSNESPIPYRRDLERWQPGKQNYKGEVLYPNWKWRRLWEAQLNYSWEPYWIAIPLGESDSDELALSIDKQGNSFSNDWIDTQNSLSNCRSAIPSAAETALYEQLNVGSWWGSLQQRLRESLQAVKNTRCWQLPAAPGSRSTLSGQFSVVHPSFEYGVSGRGQPRDLREGAGLPEGTLRFFWFLMAKAYPGVFDGSERLNALELTKRLAWKIGGVAAALGISFAEDEEAFLEEDRKRLNITPKYALRSDYDRLIRFPNLSAIASARFVHDDAQLDKGKTPRYWKQLADEIAVAFGADDRREKRSRFAARTRGRPFHISKTDHAINPDSRAGQNYNGVMFSSKWLAEDMGLETLAEETQLRAAVGEAHTKLGFGDRSPSDWWALVLADGDSMGEYVAGTRLKRYEAYLNKDAIAPADLALLEQEQPDGSSLMTTRKRMGPATHIGLNRALLDFSNRIVPYLCEKRFCGKLVYSGGDDVMAALPIEDLPGFLLSLRAAWCGGDDPWPDDDLVTFESEGGYWQQAAGAGQGAQLLPNRPLFTMGKGATMSAGIVLAHKTVPLPTVLESVRAAESERAKKLSGKNGLCFRVIYSGGNQLEVVMNGDLLASWWRAIANFSDYQGDLAPVFYRLAEELPKRVLLGKDSPPISQAAEVIMNRRDQQQNLEQNFVAIRAWLDEWERWAKQAVADELGEAWESAYLEILRGDSQQVLPLGTHPDALGQLLRFTAFWIDRRVERWTWLTQEVDS